MWFFIAEGCYYTHDRKKYITRLFILAVISHFAYDFAFGIPFVIGIVRILLHGNISTIF